MAALQQKSAARCGGPRRSRFNVSFLRPASSTLSRAALAHQRLALLKKEEHSSFIFYFRSGRGLKSHEESSCGKFRRGRPWLSR